MNYLKAAVAACVALCVSNTWADTAKTTPTTKTLYVFVPTGGAWMGATPMSYEDGKDYAMTFDVGHCGWYYRTYEDGKIPKSVVIHRDDDDTLAEAIGMNGTWEEFSTPDPISLNALFDLFDKEDTLFFVSDEKYADLGNLSMGGWSSVRPDIEGYCSFNLQALIYDTDASLHGAFSCSPDWNAAQTPEQARSNACYYATAPFQVVSSGDDEFPCIGVTTGMVESQLYTDPDTKAKRMKLTSKGKKCFGLQADTAFASMFSYRAGVNEEYCVDVMFSRTSDGKFEFNSDNYQVPGATVAGGFYPAETTPSVLISPRLPAAENKRKAEGPTFFCAEDPHDSTTKTPLGLRTIHPTEGYPVSDLLCNGPGWDGGVDCDGLFQAGGDLNLTESSIAKQISKKFNVTWAGDGWGWSCPNAAPNDWVFYLPGTEKFAGKKHGDSIPQGETRWTSGENDSEALTNAGRNQHFCFESHATFRYKKGLKFSFTGDDDIWVFIDNKLAVDLGGTHLPAPGYVDLDAFMPDADVGKSYDIDIYFCDRRTTSSNVRISTNIFLEQQKSSGIEVYSKEDKELYRTTGDNKYKVCYKEVNGGTCSVATGGAVNEWCGREILSAGKTVSYVFAKDPLGNTDIMINESDFAANPIQANGGINVSDPTAPIVNEEKLKNSGLPSGTYYLVVKIGSDSKAIKVVLKSSLGVANREAVFVGSDGKSSKPYEFKSSAIAVVPDEKGNFDVKQMIPLYIANIVDPCASSACDEPLEMEMAAGESYSLESSSAKVVFYEKKNGKLTAFNPTASRKIGSSGIDTVYAMVPMDEMDAAQEKVSVNVKGGKRKAELVFFVPQIVFVDSDSTYKVVNADTDKFVRLKGATYDFYVVALNADNSVCKDCNFALSKGTKTSAGLDIVKNSKIVNGRAKVVVRSSAVYEKCSGKSCRGAAMLQLVGSMPALMQATYSNMQFIEPPPGAINESKRVYSKAQFSVRKAAPLEFDIVLGSSPSVAKQYAVMDMNGQVLVTGTLENADTRIKVPTAGSYIVKVGQNYKQVNLK